MNRVFADSGYWIALLRSRDALHQKAQHLAQQFRDYKIVTSELVLVEYLNDMSKLGGGYRRMAVDAVKRLRNDRNMEIVPTTSQQFWEAVQYYGSRRDQRWSLVDCSSFLIMEELKIRDALAHDRDFRQAGFTALCGTTDLKTPAHPRLTGPRGLPYPVSHTIEYPQRL